MADEPQAEKLLENNKAGEVAVETPPSLGKSFFKPGTLIGFGLSAVLVIFFLFNLKLDFNTLLAELSQANLLLLGLALTLYLGVFYLRGWRWQLLLEQDTSANQPDKLPGKLALSRMVGVSWFVNCLLPARLGDVYRGYLLKGRSQATLSQALGSVAGERIVDLLAMGLLFCLSGYFIVTSGDYQLPATLGWVVWAGLALVVVAGLAIALAVCYWRSLLRWLPGKFQGFATTFMLSTLSGVQGRNRGSIYTLTGIIWLAEGLRLWLVCASLNLAGLNLAVIIFCALLASLLSVIPFTPGGSGAVEGVTVVAFIAFGVPASLASAIVLLDRLISYWSNLPIGAALYVAELRFSKK